jgi:hypothetical protein
MAILRRLTAAVMTLAILPACTPSPTSVVTSAPVFVSASPTPTPTLSATCTGTGPAPTPRPCDQATKDAEQRALEEQAKAVYGRFWTEYTRLVEAGGVAEATPELAAVLTPAALGDVMALLKYQKENALRPDPFQAQTTVHLRRPPTQPDAEVTLITCEDTRGSVFRDQAGVGAGNGVLNVQFTSLKRTGGSLRIFHNEDGPSTCPTA